MIWATVSSRSCFCWLYRTFPSSATKNIINLFSVLTIWWCLYVESSLVLLEERVCCECILLTKLLGFALLHFVLQDQTCLLLQVSLDFQLLHSSPSWWVGHLFLVSVLGSIVGLHRIIQLHLLWHCSWGIDYCDVEWFAWETNQDHSVVFDIALKYCILDLCWPWGLLHFF